jgi:hypothetical protein
MSKREVAMISITIEMKILKRKEINGILYFLNMIMIYFAL